MTSIGSYATPGSELERVSEALAMLFPGDCDRQRRWIGAPNKVFDGRSAADVINGEEGGAERVIKYLLATIYGA
jgi:hypothetical protein